MPVIRPPSRTIHGAPNEFVATKFALSVDLPDRGPGLASDNVRGFVTGSPRILPGRATREVDYTGNSAVIRENCKVTL